MIKTLENDNELTVNYYPVLPWSLIAASLLLILPALYYSIYLAVGPLILLFAGVFLAFDNPMATLIINKELKSLSISKNNIFKQSFVRIGFDQIEPGVLIKTITSDEGKLHFMQIALKSGRKIDVMPSGGYLKRDFYETIDLVNKYMPGSEEGDFKLTILHEDGSWE